ncbi:MAG: UDP-3-O-(3-hydroxymyristoyl)glucosamine N-acyltransferase, partial [Alphaproteobacteria bacterium]|nr:UDP-3-O-(3-hydroxymyristoyl)glucosamine N-acyltransferase [Alphaproteobacteria bacterium]
MPDPRFFDSLPALSVAELAERVGGEVIRGGDRQVSAVAPLGSAGPGDVAFLGDRKFVVALGQTGAGCVILPAAAVEASPADAALIMSEEPQAAWARASILLHKGVPFTVADPAAAAEDDSVVFEPGVVIGSGARIGEAGFGAARSKTGPVDVPQLGRVILQDGVT